MSIKVGVLHVNSSGAMSTSPTMRIARFVADELRVPFVHNMATAREFANTKFDVLFVKYGMLKFSAHRDEALRIYANARRVISMENDYLFVLDKRFRAPDARWSTVEGREAYVNWNIITRHGADAWSAPPPKLFWPLGTNSILYYGAYRLDREKSFKKYFLDAPYRVTASSFRGGKKFAALGCQPIGAFRHPDGPAQWPLTIYMEDEESHRTYCSPATRFYECVMMGLAQVVDEAAVGTLRKAGIKMSSDFVVNSKSDVKRALGRWQKIQVNQRDLWWKDYSKELRAQFRAACKKEGIAG